MTGLLKDVMDARAEALDVPDLDVAAMVRDGDHLVVRRRRTLASGLIAASLVVAGAVAVPSLLPDGDVDGDVDGTVAGATHSYDLAYAEGTTIHDGPRTIEAGVRISALVQGISGYVVADPHGRVHAVVAGETTQIGLLAAADRGRLVSDDDVVAWVDAADGGTLSVLDIATGERTDTAVDVFPGEPPAATGLDDTVGADIVAVDGRTVYVSDGRGVMAWDALDSKDPVLLPAPDGVEVAVLDVQDGQILQVVRSFEPEETDGSTTMVQVEELRVGADLEDTTSLPGTGGRLSPGGQLAAVSDQVSRRGSPTLTTTEVGEISGDSWTPIEPRGYESVTPYQWLDADTFAAAGGTYNANFARQDLLSCEASTAECTVEVRGVPDGLVAATGAMTP